MKKTPRTALFVPLKKEHFLAFEDGSKTTEYRPFGPRWNQNTVIPGRAVVLSLGYGKKNRLTARVASLTIQKEPPDPVAWRSVYGDRRCLVAAIEMENIKRQA